MCKQIFSLKIDIDSASNNNKALELKEIFFDTIDKLNNHKDRNRDNINSIVISKPIYDNMGICMGNEVVMSFEIK